MSSVDTGQHPWQSFF